MQSDVAVRLLARLRDEIPALTDTGSADFVSWNQRTRSALVRSIGETHAITREFTTVQWHPRGFIVEGSYENAFHRGQAKARGLLDAAISELEDGGGNFDAVADDGIDPELWEHVRQVVEANEWG